MREGLQEMILISIRAARHDVPHFTSNLILYQTCPENEACRDVLKDVYIPDI